MPFILLVVGGVALVALNHEYQQVKARIETTQRKLDTLADETNATVEILGAAIQDLRDVFQRFKAEQSPKQVDLLPSKPTIVMHSGASCGPCNDWKAKQMPVWTKAGWDVQVITEIDSNRMWPWFEVQDSDGTRFEVNGALTVDSFRAAKGMVK